MKFTRLAVAAIAALVLSTTSATAATISYQATDIADSGSGDAWQYTYFISDHTFAERDAFSILFDQSLFTALNPTPAPVAGWDILVLQPSVTLPAAGRYEPLALTDGAPVNYAFTLDFIWLGAGTPGSQSYELIHYDDDFNPTVTSTGVTVPAGAVPEPSTWMLLAGGVSALALARRRS